MNRKLQPVPFGSTHFGILESCGQYSCCWYIFNFLNENISETWSKQQSFPKRHIASAPHWPNWAEEQEHPYSSKGIETGRGWMRWIPLNNNKWKWGLVKKKKRNKTNLPLPSLPPTNQPKIPQTKTLKPNRNRTKNKVYQGSCLVLRRVILKFYLTNAIILVFVSASFKTYQSPGSSCWSLAAHLPANSHMVNYWEQSHPSKRELLILVRAST